MSRSSVNGLQSALRLYESDKVKERNEGQSKLRDIFSNRDNLLIFQDSASGNGGAGWVAFFQCLFQVVVLEKKALLRKSATAQAEKRLADSISLVRWMAEKSVHMISRKPLQALVTHMTCLLVFAGKIFPPAALDYAKALRSLLSYPPHLENLDRQAWKVLLGVCWAALLGEEVTMEDEWDDEQRDELEDEDTGSGGMPPGTQAAASFAKGRSSVTQATTELALLIPILLSSTAAPLFHPLPLSRVYHYEPSLGLSILLKTQRFFILYPVETSSHLPILRSMNTILAALELNCRDDFIAGGAKLLPGLVDLWSAKNKAIREQVLIALRMILPFQTHKVAMEKDKLGLTRAVLDRLMDILPKETVLKSGFTPLDLGVLRMRTYVTGDGEAPKPFETRVFTAGHDFDHESALRWASVELYSEICFHLYQSHDKTLPSTPNRDPTQTAKRRKMSDSLSSLTHATSFGPTSARIHALQVLIFTMDRHWNDIHLEGQTSIRQNVVGLLEEEDTNLQNWAFVATAMLATLPSTDTSAGSTITPASPPARTVRALGSTDDLTKAWSHAMRKITLAPLSRSACHAANALLLHGKIDLTSTVRDLGNLLRSIDIQGPSYPHDSVCTLIGSAIRIARQDVRLYALNLEDKVISWLSKWNALEGTRGKGRLDQHSPSDILHLICEILHLPSPTFDTPSTIDFLPDCAIVERVLEEDRTNPMRRFTLYGKITELKRNSPTKAAPIKSTESDAGSAFLHGRPQRISRVVKDLIDSFARDWPTVQSGSEARPAMPPDRCRRTIDLIVLALAYNATLHINGIRADNESLQAASSLMDRVIPLMTLSAYDIPSQHLMWKGLQPLIKVASTSTNLWPVLLKPNSLSGIRKDLLPPGEEEAEDHAVLAEVEDRLLTTIWNFETVTITLKGLFPSCLKMFSGSEAPTPTTASPYAPTQGMPDDDDDFGEIRTAESDAMPISKEAIECQRTTRSLLALLANVRLRGSILLSPNRLPSKDNALINSFLSTEGTKMVQLGSVLCDAIQAGTLRLNVEAVDLILSTLEEMLGSYAYSRDEGSLQLMLSFMTGSAPIWLSPDNSSVDLADRVVHLAKFLHIKSLKGQLPSWKVRLALLRFVDEYLDYEPEQTAWSRGGQSMDIDGSASAAVDIISGALVDIDIRLRFRAATSTAGLLYLSSIPFDQHLPFYHDTVNALPREPKHWDSFITDILWKLNCCITSPQLRAATIYHLYEVPPATTDYNHHLQVGLETVSKRLGLEGIAPLLLAYAPLIISSQIVTSQSPMRVPHRLYGFSTRRLFAVNILDVAGSSVLLAMLAQKTRHDDGARQYAGSIDTLTGLCSAAGSTPGDVAVRHLASTAARALSDPHSPLVLDPNAYDRAVVFGALASLPGIRPKERALKKSSAKDADTANNDAMPIVVEDVATHLFALLDLNSTDEDIITFLDARDPKHKIGSCVYGALMTSEIVMIASAPALTPSATIEDALDGLSFLSHTYPSLSIAKVLFNTLTRLFHQVNEDFLVSEQYRHLRGIALAVSLYSGNMAHPAILGLFLRETVPLLRLIDVAPIALAMLRWGFDQISKAPSAPDDIDQLVIGLGSIRNGLSSGTEDTPIVTGFDAWMTASCPAWQKIGSMRPALAIARTVWPEHLAKLLDSVDNPSFRQLCANTKTLRGIDTLPLCNAMVKTLDTSTSKRTKDLQAFQQEAFWRIKSSLRPDLQHDSDISAFIDLLYAGHGQVHPPTLNADQPVEKDRLEPLKTRLKEEAGPYLRAALVDRIVLMTRVSEYRARHAALAVLQGILPYIKDEKTGSLVPTATKDLLSLLNPVTPITPPKNDTSVSVLTQDSTWIKRSREAAVWSSNLAGLLCSSLASQQPFYSVIPLLFETIPTAARDLLPYLVQASLSSMDLAKSDTLPTGYAPLSACFMQVLQYPSASIDTLRAIVDIVLHLRNYQPPYRQEELGYDEWLDLDYLVLSDAALKCGAYATALMFLELVRSDKAKRKRAVDLYNDKVQEIMYEAYSNVEDPDGFYGIKTQDAWAALDKRLRHEGDHWRSFGIHSGTLEAGSTNPDTASTSSFAVMRDLHNLGFDRVGNAIFASMRTTSDESATNLSEPLLFELAWRTSDWDLPVSVDTQSSPESLLYSSLRAVHRERDLVIAQKTVSTALDVHVGTLRDSGVEKITQVKKTVADLLCLHEIKQWLDPKLQRDLESRDIDTPSLKRFTSLDSTFSFADAEKIFATRRSLLTAARERESQNLFGDLGSPRIDFLISLEARCLLRLGEVARSEGNTQASINALCALKKLNNGLSDDVQEEFGQVLWAQGEHILAIRHLEGRVKVLKASKDKSGSKMAILLSRMANWTSRAKLRAPQDINNLFEEAVKLSQAFKLSAVELGRLYHDYAIFADHHQAALYKSPELERLNTSRDRREAEQRGASQITSSKKSTKSSVRTQATDKYEKEIREDEEALNALLDERSLYARTALRMFAKSLASSDEYDDSTTRMCSLWLEHDQDDEINTAFTDPLIKIPSHKFIFLSPQLTARIDRPKTPTPFNNALDDLVLRISREHPFHILYQVITLADGLSSMSKSRRTSEIGSEGRGPAAAAILAQIAASKDAAFNLARSASADMQQLATAATNWCLSRNSEEESASIGKSLAVPANCPLKTLPPKMTIPVATATIPIDPLGRYSGVPTLFRYRTTYSILGGIHRPKRMQLYDTQGTIYKELFKGEDELRQDAVMEQVFEMSNKLLTRDRKTKARDLRFRTYKVIPLARKTGIMEFVGNSQAIGDWLKPAHARYGKINGDIPAEEFRKRISPLQDKEKNWAQAPAVFTDLQSKFSPVLRHFFTEKHRDPMAWFTMRLNYTRSVAVTSMVGWVLGIGDRHCSNILIDQMSGELVHIDFGIVFEDGRALRIPEKVPFRLTNDLVDGFGLTGVDGTFRQCSEHTLRVLRESSELIMTVLEVFKHDPLYAWDADPEKMQRAQGGGRVSAGTTSTTAVEKADRILSKIQGKLRDDLSVEYTVNQLIQEARDVENLAKIFVGWQPWF